MRVALLKADISDAKELHAMQIKAFKELLEKYRDFETSPASEGVEKVEARLKQENFPDFYIAGISGKRHCTESNPAM